MQDEDQWAKYWLTKKWLDEMMTNHVNKADNEAVRKMRLEDLRRMREQAVMHLERKYGYKPAIEL